jgi:uncharacterized protein YndB with AHSA1/START domain
MNNRTTYERKSDRESVVSRAFDAPARAVFEAWANPQLFKQWWVPKSSGLTLLSHEADVRVGGGYRLEFSHPSSETPIAFFGKYREVIPYSRLVWTNEESADGAVTTVTFHEKSDKTLLVMHELYPSKQALEANAVTGDGMNETFSQLDELLLAAAAND